MLFFRDTVFPFSWKGEKIGGESGMGSTKLVISSYVFYLGTIDE